MSELGDLLELLHGARDRYRTLRATVAGLDASTPAVRVWLEPPGRIREERESDSGAGILWIRNGERSWIYYADGTVDSNEDDPDLGTSVAEGTRTLFDPAPLIGSLHLEPLGRGEASGRPVVLARGVPRRGVRCRYDLQRHGIAADEIALAVDLDRGVLLRRIARSEGKDLDGVEVREIEFDSVLPAELFEPQPGPPKQEAERPQVEEVPLEGAAARASFAVWTPGRLDEWDLTAHYVPASGAGGPESVYFQIWRADGRKIFVHEAPAAEPDWTSPPGKWESRERGGEIFEVVAPLDGNGRQASVRMSRGTTRILLFSRTVGLETVLELASRLRPS